MDRGRHHESDLWRDAGLVCESLRSTLPHIIYYTPTNEPYICATFDAEWAIWYPFLRGDRNAVRAIKNITEGVVRSMLEIRQIRPDVLLMIADTCEYYRSVAGAFKEEAEFRSERRFLVHDMYQGLVHRDHPMWQNMIDNGLEDWELEWFVQNPVKLDLLGLDYYRHSEHQLRLGPHGERIDETAEDQFGWAEMTRQYSARYNGIPVILGETNWGGPVEERIAWMEKLVAETHVARSAGTPVAGLTYWNAIDHMDWASILRVRNLSIEDVGMWSLRWQGDKLVRTPTALVDWYRRQIALPVAETVGELSDPEAAERVRAVLAPVAKAVS